MMQNRFRAASSIRDGMKSLKIPQIAAYVFLLFCIAKAIHAAEESRPGFKDALVEIDTIFKAKPGLEAVRHWTSSTRGSVRLVGYIQKLSLKTDAMFDVLVDGKTIWNRKLNTTDSIRHGFDIIAYDLNPASKIDFRVVAGSKPVRVSMSFQIVLEPFISRWKPDLLTGYPTWSEDEKKGLRKKGQEILQQIRKASKMKHRKIVIPSGDYLFHANWSHASTLKGLADLEIIANDVTFWFEPPIVHALLFENCRNVTVRGLTIDFTIPCWSQARITEIDRKNKTIHAILMKGYEPRGEKGSPETSGERKLIFYNANGGFINHRHTRGDWKLSDDKASITYSNIRVSGIPDKLKIGDYAVSPILTGAALRSKNCARMHFEDVNIWSSPGMAVYESGGAGGNVYKRVRATRRPHTNRLQAFGADIFHLTNTDRGPTLDRCEMAYGADDNLNIHGSFGRVVKRLDDRRYYLQGAYDTGDTIEFRDFKSVNILGLAKVVSAKNTPDGPSLPINDKYEAKGEFLVELEKPLELPPLSIVVLDGKQSAAGFVLRNCWLHDNFQRTLINGSPGGIIENNTLQNVGHGICIQFETWGPWMEGPFARDLVVRNNRFLDSPPDDALISVSMYPPGGGSNRRRFKAKPVTNMTIVGNYFGRTSGTPLNIHNVDGLKIHGNSIDHPVEAPIPTGLDNASIVNWLYLQDCENVSIQKNQAPANTGN